MIQDLKAFDGLEADKQRKQTKKPAFATVVDYKEEAGKRMAKVIFDGDSVALESYLLCTQPVTVGSRAVIYYASGQMIILGGV